MCTDYCVVCVSKQDRQGLSVSQCRCFGGKAVEIKVLGPVSTGLESNIFFSVQNRVHNHRGHCWFNNGLMESFFFSFLASCLG